jgi:uncharacterized protein YlzI (FlbEa/FlbD family)
VAKLIELTKIELLKTQGRTIYVNPDHIVTIGSVLGDLDSGAVVTLPMRWALAPHQIVVKQSLREVLEKIDTMDKAHG